MIQPAAALQTQQPCRNEAIRQVHTAWNFFSRNRRSWGLRASATAAAFGLPFPATADRGQRLEATLETMRALWSAGTKAYDVCTPHAAPCGSLTAVCPPFDWERDLDLDADVDRV